MGNESKNEAAYDSHEQELQQTDEMQRLSEEVLALVRDDDPPIAPTSAARASSDSYALKIQAAQGLKNAQPPQRAESAPAQLLNERAQAGANYTAPGNAQLVTAELSSYDSGEVSEVDLEESVRDTILSPSEGVLVYAVKVEVDAEEERLRRQIFEEALQVTEVELVAEAPLEEHGNRKWKLSVYLLCGVLALLGLIIIGLFVDVGFNRKRTPETPLPEPFIPTPFIPTLEAVRQRGVLRCGSPDIFFYIQSDPVTGKRVGFEVDLVSSLFLCLW